MIEREQMVFPLRVYNIEQMWRSSQRRVWRAEKSFLLFVALFHFFDQRIRKLIVIRVRQVQFPPPSDRNQTD